MDLAGQLKGQSENRVPREEGRASNPLASLSEKTAAGLISASVKASDVKEERSVSKEICSRRSI